MRYTGCAAELCDAFPLPFSIAEQELFETVKALLDGGADIDDVQYMVCQEVGVYKGKALVKEACKTIS